MKTKLVEEYIEQQKQWIDQLNKSLSHMEKLKLGKITVSDERWSEIVKSHKNIASAIALLSKLTSNSI